MALGSIGTGGFLAPTGFGDFLSPIGNPYHPSGTRIPQYRTIGGTSMGQEQQAPQTQQLSPTWVRGQAPLPHFPLASPWQPMQQGQQPGGFGTISRAPDPQSKPQIGLK